MTGFQTAFETRLNVLSIWGGDTGWYDHARCCVDRFLSGDLLILVNDLFVPLLNLECRCFCGEQVDAEVKRSGELFKLEPMKPSRWV